MRVTTDNAGTLSNQQAHYPYGENWYATGTADPSVTRKFTSYRKEGGSLASGQINHAVTRYHGSRIGRFQSPDSSSGKGPQTSNGYSYAGNNPINSTWWPGFPDAPPWPWQLCVLNPRFPWVDDFLGDFLPENDPGFPWFCNNRRGAPTRHELCNLGDLGGSSFTNTGGGGGGGGPDGGGPQGLVCGPRPQRPSPEDCKFTPDDVKVEWSSSVPCDGRGVATSKINILRVPDGTEAVDAFFHVSPGVTVTNQYFDDVTKTGEANYRAVRSGFVSHTIEWRVGIVCKGKSKGFSIARSVKCSTPA